MLTPKKLLLSTLFAAMTCTAAFNAQAKELTVGLAVANLQADFFNQIKQAVEAEGKAKGIKVITVDAQGNSATQVNQIQDRITRQVDALIYIPAGATAAGVPVKPAKAAGIPLVAVDRNAPDAPGDTFIASDSVAAARTLAEYVGKARKAKAKGGVTSVEVEKIDRTDADHAVVTTVTRFGDGSTQTDTGKMRRVNGKWYITM